MATSSNSTTIPFHKHCQQTVCSAYGYGGQGATWEVISTLNLPHLDSDWKDLFTRNENNITEDLASILMLIDNVADQVSSMGAIKGFTISFQDANGVEIASQDFSSSSRNYSVQLGRQVDLIINGETFSFNTMHSDEHDKLVGTLQEKKIDVKVGGSSVGSVNVVASDSKDLALAAHTLEFKPEGMNGVLGSASVIWPEDQVIRLAMHEVNLMQGNIGGGRLIGSFNTIYPAIQPIALKEMNLKLNIGNTEVSSIPFISYADQVLKLTPRSLTLKAGNTTLGSAQIVAEGDKTISLATKNLKLTMGGTTLATVPIPMESPKDVNIPTKEITFKKDAMSLGSFNIVGKFPDTNAQELIFQQEYNLSPSYNPGKYTPLKNVHYPSGYTYVFNRFHVKPETHVYRIMDVAFGDALVNFYLGAEYNSTDNTVYSANDVVNFELTVSNSTDDGRALDGPRKMIFPQFWLSIQNVGGGWTTKFIPAPTQTVVSGLSRPGGTLRQHVEHLRTAENIPLGPIATDGTLSDFGCWYYEIPAGCVDVFTIRLDMKYKIAIIEKKYEY